MEQEPTEFMDLIKDCKEIIIAKLDDDVKSLAALALMCKEIKYLVTKNLSDLWSPWEEFIKKYKKSTIKLAEDLNITKTRYEFIDAKIGAFIVKFDPTQTLETLIIRFGESSAEWKNRNKIHNTGRFIWRRTNVGKYAS